MDNKKMGLLACLGVFNPNVLGIDYNSNSISRHFKIRLVYIIPRFMANRFTFIIRISITNPLGRV